MAWDINQHNACSVSIAAFKFCPCKASKVAFVHASLHYLGCKGPKRELECSSILSVVKVLVGIVCRDGAECVLAPVDFGE